MAVKVYAATLIGLEGQTVEVEVDITRGLYKFEIVGLAGKAVQEAKERVAAAIKNSGADFPRTHITVNLAPADIPKNGPLFDLPIAIGILLESGQLDLDLEGKVFLGELSLEGKVRSVPGMLPIAEFAQKSKFKELFLPEDNVSEAKIIKGLKVIGVENLEELFNVKNLYSRQRFHMKTHSDYMDYIYSERDIKDFRDIKSQSQAKRAVTIAAAGGHNVLLSGSPGSGKSMLAKRLPGILPKMTIEESLEVTKIYSSINSLPKHQPLIIERPFRSPHHTISQIALVGGGSYPRPGEISLAHKGVLFLDEFTEFTNSAHEALRQPLEDNRVTISRASGSITYPANFMLIAAMNPCKCGFLGDSERECICTKSQIEYYAKKLSGPILDRIDLQVMVKKVKIASLSKNTKEETTFEIAKKVQNARNIQISRYKELNIQSNADLDDSNIYKFIKLKKSTRALINAAAEKMGLSARSYFRTLKVARTIADLESVEQISRDHISEALGYRMKTSN